MVIKTLGCHTLDSPSKCAIQLVCNNSHIYLANKDGSIPAI